MVNQRFLVTPHSVCQNLLGYLLLIALPLEVTPALFVPVLSKLTTSQGPVAVKTKEQSVDEVYTPREQKTLSAALYASLLVDVSTGLCGNGTPPAVTGASPSPPNSVGQYVKC